MSSPETAAKVRKLAPRPVLQATRLVGQLRERLRYLHYSIRTEESYVYWVRFFIRFHGMRHPREMGRTEVEAFLTMLATERHVSVATHRQALSALLFLDKEVLDASLPWLAEVGRPIPTRRLPAVLSVPEVQSLLDVMQGESGLLARLLHGTGLHIRTVQELLGHSDVATTMIYTHVLKFAAGSTRSPLDRLPTSGPTPASVARRTASPC